MGNFRRLNSARHAKDGRRLLRAAREFGAKGSDAKDRRKQESVPEIVAETTGWAGKPVSTPTEEYYVHQIDRYQLDGYWTDRVASSLGAVYRDLSKVEVFVPKSSVEKELFAYVHVEPDITASDKSLMQQVWTKEAEDFYVQSGRFGQDLASDRKSIRNSVNARLLLLVDDD